MLNLKGEVIGVNAAIASQSGGFEGIGFAIPSNMAVAVARALIEDGKVKRGWLGVSIGAVSGAGEKKWKQPAPEPGVYIADLVPGGPAETAGMKEEDRVVAFDGQAVEVPEDLRNRAAATAIGKKVAVKVLRAGKPVELAGDLDDAELTAVDDRTGRVGTVQVFVK